MSGYCQTIEIIFFDGKQFGCLAAGGEKVRSVVPLGYAGNPAGYEKKISTAKVIFEKLADYCAQKIIEDNLAE